MIATIVQCTFGAITWGLHSYTKVRPDIVFYINLAHQLIGYIILILIATQLIVITVD